MSSQNDPIETNPNGDEMDLTLSNKIANYSSNRMIVRLKEVALYVQKGHLRRLGWLRGRGKTTNFLHGNIKNTVIPVVLL